jgi:signal-transduction protein with cAMP-binding, CBS, and nucleotidyltransferase domain
MVSVTLVRTILLFAGVGDDALQQLASTASLKRYQRGQFILQAEYPGTLPAKYLYVLLSGRVRVSITSSKICYAIL